MAKKLSPVCNWLLEPENFVRKLDRESNSIVLVGESKKLKDITHVKIPEDFI